MLSTLLLLGLVGSTGAQAKGQTPYPLSPYASFGQPMASIRVEGAMYRDQYPAEAGTSMRKVVLYSTKADGDFQVTVMPSMGTAPVVEEINVVGGDDATLSGTTKNPGRCGWLRDQLTMHFGAPVDRVSVGKSLKLQFQDQSTRVVVKYNEFWPEGPTKCYAYARVLQD